MTVAISRGWRRHGWNGDRCKGMPGSWPPQDLPHLTEHNCIITSPATADYNCLAWAGGDDTRWWEPDPMGQYYWPDDAPRTLTTDAFLRAYSTLGFRLFFYC